MGLFDFFKKPKSDLEQYYEERSKRTEQESFYNDSYSASPSFRIVVQDVFTITGRGTVIVGQVESGSVRTGDTVTLQRLNGETQNVTVTGIEQFRKIVDIANTGDNVGILLRGITKNDISKGDVLTK